MLDRLDNIPWNTLHHAFGTAEDLPVQLRALANISQPSQQAEALNELYGNIWHQGTVYEASAYAVPFLFELATDTGNALRADILGLIGALADGKSYLAVHAQTENGFSATLREQADFEAKLALEQQDVMHTRSEVLRHTDSTRILLQDSKHSGGIKAWIGHYFKPRK